MCFPSFSYIVSPMFYFSKKCLSKILYWEKYSRHKRNSALVNCCNEMQANLVKDCPETEHMFCEFLWTRLPFLESMTCVSIIPDTTDGRHLHIMCQKILLTHCKVLIPSSISNYWIGFFFLNTASNKLAIQSSLKGKGNVTDHKQQKRWFGTWLFSIPSQSFWCSF